MLERRTDLSQNEEEAADVLEQHAGATPVDIYGTAWGRVLDGVDPSALMVSGTPSIEIPDGIPDVDIDTTG